MFDRLPSLGQLCLDKQATFSYVWMVITLYPGSDLSYELQVISTFMHAWLKIWFKYLF